MSEHSKRTATPEAVSDPFFGIGDPGALEAYFASASGERPVRRALSPPAVGNGAAEAALIEAYRTRGFLKAAVDPLGLAQRPEVLELQPAVYGFMGDAAGPLIERLERTYCGPIGWEFGHIHDPQMRRWLAAEAEGAESTPDKATAERILALLARGVAFEAGMALRYPGGRLFGLGGAESFLVAVQTIIAESIQLGVEEVVVGGMHRGRFNLLANVLGKPVGQLVAEVLGKPAVPDGLACSSDVSYHLGYSGELEIAGRQVHVSVSAHPSHLQLIPIISQGRARAKQAARGNSGKQAVLPLLLHTDASFAGQGLVAEMLQLSGVGPFDIGGTIHVVINNQLGFTTTAEEGRTARGATDIARLIEAPVLHVNGDDPEAVWRVALVAANWRAIFGRDIVIDLVCYRRPGHNEIDEPRFTQPVMYRAVDGLPPVDQLYEAVLGRREVGGGITERVRAEMASQLSDAFQGAKSYKTNSADWFGGAWAGFKAGSVSDMLAPVETGMSAARLQEIVRAITTPPADFVVDPKVMRFLDERRRSVEEGHGITWATGEALALATLAHEGKAVRLGGQDTVRGAFTQRHLELHCQTTGQRHLTLAPAAARPGLLEIHNTPLIEHAVLCFEYGLTMADPNRLVIWEAQFGEFLNYAQAVFDQCIACGEDRWLRSSGLTILLPHGLDGGGPDHSTGRPERLLAACAGANLAIVNASTPANFFHALRRQMHRPFRKPLVVLSPKALLRHKACVSSIAEMTEGTGFQPVIAEPVKPGARRVVIATGKITHELAEARAARGLVDKVALIRLEQLYPLDEAALGRALAPYARAELVWAEEEPENMGIFTSLDRALERIGGRRFRRAGRPAVATPAVGVKYWHEAEAKAVIEAALGGLQ